MPSWSIALLALAWPLLGQAQDVSDPALVEVIDLYESMEYEEVARTLEGMDLSALAREDQLLALMYLGMANVVLGRQDAAKRAFGRLLSLDPAHTLPGQVSPKILNTFEQVRQEVEESRPAASPQGPQGQIALDRPLEPVALEMAGVGARFLGVGRVRLLAYYRLAGTPLFKPLEAPGDPLSLVAFRFPLERARLASGEHSIEYYLVAYDGAGRTVAQMGHRASPLTQRVVVQGQTVAAATPWYGRWWVWTIVGGVVAGGLAAGLAVGLSGEEPTTLRISITP